MSDSLKVYGWFMLIYLILYILFEIFKYIDGAEDAMRFFILLSLTYHFDDIRRSNK